MECLTGARRHPGADREQARSASRHRCPTGARFRAAERTGTFCRLPLPGARAGFGDPHPASGSAPAGCPALSVYPATAPPRLGRRGGCCHSPAVTPTPTPGSGGREVHPDVSPCGPGSRKPHRGLRLHLLSGFEIFPVLGANESWRLVVDDICLPGDRWCHTPFTGL